MLSTNSTTNDSSVQILSWWGYFSDTNKLKELEEICNSNIVVTEYHNTSELLALVKQHTYDIYIYPLGYQNEVEEFLPYSSLNLDTIAKNHHPVYKDKAALAQLPKNSLFFQDAITVIAYDQKLTPNAYELSLKSILALANNHIIYLPNDVKQTCWMLEQHSLSNEPIRESFFDLTSNPKFKGLRFSNECQNLSEEGFSVGFFDSGEIFNSIKNIHTKSSNIDITLHSSLSHSSSDIITIRSEKKQAVNLIHYLGSFEFLTWLSQKHSYCNPYGYIPLSFPEKLKTISSSLYKNEDNPPWIDLELLKNIKENAINV